MLSTAIVLICVDLLTLAYGQFGRGADTTLDSEPMQKTEMEIPSTYCCRIIVVPLLRIPSYKNPSLTQCTPGLKK